MYDIYIDSENKNTLAYNIFEVKQVIYSIAYPYSRQPKAWYKNKEIQREINYKERYEKDVYKWISTFLYANCISECDRAIIEPLIYEWMIKKEDIKEWIKYPCDERKLVKLIDEIILNVSYGTNDLELCWGVILLKNTTAV